MLSKCWLWQCLVSVHYRSEVNRAVRVCRLFATHAQQPLSLLKWWKWKTMRGWQGQKKVVPSVLLQGTLLQPLGAMLSLLPLWVAVEADSTQYCTPTALPPSPKHSMAVQESTTNVTLLLQGTELGNFSFSTLFAQNLSVSLGAVQDESRICIVSQPLTRWESS